MKNDIQVHIAGARSSAVGEAHGISPGDLRDLVPRLRAAHGILLEDRRKKRYGFYDLYRDTQTLAKVKKTAAHFLDKRYDNLVLLGIGGSALGATALLTALKPPYYNLLGRDERMGFPRLFVMDNVDPGTFSHMLRLCPPERTLFNVISKSGGTAETIAQLMITVGVLEDALGKEKLKDHLVVTVGRQRPNAKPNALQYLRKERNLQALFVPDNVGGRFSIFSPVGLFPAAMLGIDVDALAGGCAAMDARCSSVDLRENPAYLRAAYHYLAWRKKGKTISVMMPYADALRDVADWYCQIWAESLGKSTSLDGSEECLYVGQTPVRALGATDQHSQLQLYLEGPNDKIITFLEARRLATALPIPDTLPMVGGLEYLRGKTMNQLLASECKATRMALREANRPVIRVVLPRVDTHTVAQLLYMLEVETAMAGQLFNVNAFDQPAVERIKVLTRKYMGGKG